MTNKTSGGDFLVISGARRNVAGSRTIRNGPITYTNQSAVADISRYGNIFGGATRKGY